MPLHLRRLNKYFGIDLIIEKWVENGLPEPLATYRKEKVPKPDR